MPLQSNQKTFLKGAVAGAALMDWRKSIPLIGFGIFFCLSALPILFGATHVRQVSRVLMDVPLQTPEEVAGGSGFVKISGVPRVEGALVDPVSSTSVLTYHLVESEYKLRPVEKQRTIQEEGKTYTETYVDYETQWVVTKDETRWADFWLGNIEVDARQAELRVDPTEFYNQTTDLSVDLTLPEERLADVPQQRKVVVDGILPNEPLVVVGLLSQGRISSGQDGVFIVSNKTDGRLIEEERTNEQHMRQAGFVGAWFFLTLGLFLIFLPLARVINILPGVGFVAGMLLFAASATLCGILVGTLYLGLQYWWLVPPIVLAIAVGLSVLKKKAAPPT